MKAFEQKFTIHPVGHGLFYSGIMKFRNNNQNENTFRFVFDCGSLPKYNKYRDEEIEEFQKNDWKEDKPLDLLIISHFHSDHINGIQKLLKDRKVKQVIAPFLNFKERLFLFLLVVFQNEYEIRDPDSLFMLRFILDPVSTIQEHLTEKGEIIFIKSGKIRPFEKVENNPERDLPTLEENENTIFDLLPEEWHDITPSEKKEVNYSGKEKVKIMADTSKLVCNSGSVPFIEFLFYRKKIDQNEIAFYELVYNLILARFPTIINIDQNLANTITTFLEQSGISEAISDILEYALNLSPNLKISKTQLRDLNTTSLSLLHYNTPTMFHLLDNLDLKYNAKSAQVINKLDGTNNTRYEFPFEYIDSWKFPFITNRQRYRYHIQNIFPNTLLTSDSVLVEDEDIDPFFQKYKHYWLNYWLFQIPHHGSKKNIDRNLLSRIINFVFLFINHPIKSSNHPSQEVISEVILTGHSSKLLSVNECMGFKFGLIFTSSVHRLHPSYTR